MMPTASEMFSEQSEIIPFNLEHRKKMQFNTARCIEKTTVAGKQYKTPELARKRAAYTKYKSLTELDKYLVDFELKFTANGGKVIWARDESEAIEEIRKILKKSGVRNVIKSDSLITEEIGFNDAMKRDNIQVLETGMARFAIQLEGEKPYHITLPLIHKSQEDIAKIFHQQCGLPEKCSPEEVAAFVRTYMRERFFKAEAGITGVHFLVADTGSVCITENEGNALLSASLPPICIAIGGIEEIIPSLEDVDLFWPLLSTYKTGEKLTAYNTVINGPRQENETDGPEEMYVILIDNGRTQVLEKEEQRIALSCIRCGACLNACPVYRNIGGHAYGTSCIGPIGAVITPHMRSVKEYNHLSFASTLCGKCSEVCPVKIPLHELLLKNRSEAVESGYVPGEWKTVFYGWKKAMMKRWMFDLFSAGIKNRILYKTAKKQWGDKRELPEIKSKSFNKLWKEKILSGNY